MLALKIYKKGQGYYTRMGTAVGAGAISALGCYSLYNRLDAIRTGGVITSAGKTWLQAGIPAVLFVALGYLVFKLVNTPRWADFMIATEGEMKKVSWSSKKEIVASTKVVIITVILLAILLAVVDVGFANLFEAVGVLKVIGS